MGNTSGIVAWVLLLSNFHLKVSGRSLVQRNAEFGGSNGTKLVANLQASCDCGWRNSQALKIVGGTETGTNEYPAMAALLSLQDDSFFCGSHVIASRYILTAGHCLQNKDPDELVVLVGDHNISSGSDTNYSAIYYVSAYEINPSYDSDTYSYDIAIVQTKTEISFSTYVGPVCLPFRYYSNDFALESVTLLGWGQTEFSGPSSDVLLEATLQVLSNEDCANETGDTILDSELCTYADGKDACQQDSGGPVLWTDSTTNRMHLVGIISHGVACATANPGINSRVTSFLTWIVSRTSDATYCYM
ncbi:venom serine protease 34-like [Anthonomus grandis grandis]|uniref:venom serine protease 34-like n=1 Tax=Anthonomus grandis grandis TaxID=2921223 RepID=UPI002165B299|nr:venom serine protease 34-like [Anthonomus grandis grandis]